MPAPSRHANTQLGLLNHFELLYVFPIGHATKGLHVLVKRGSCLIGHKLIFAPYGIALEAHQKAVLRRSLETNAPNDILLTEGAELHFGKAVISWVVPSRTTI